VLVLFSIKAQQQNIGWFGIKLMCQSEAVVSMSYMYRYKKYNYWYVIMYTFRYILSITQTTHTFPRDTIQPYTYTQTTATKQRFHY
jgi:hypothetical protein